MRALVVILGLCACGGGVADNQATLTSTPGAGQVTITGAVGSSFTEAEIRSMLLEPACSDEGLTLSTVEITPGSGDSKEVSALCT